MAALPPLTVLLEIWEAVCGMPPVERDLAFLAVRMPGSDPAERATIRIGDRDAQVIALYEACYGRQLDVLLTCGCTQVLEISIDLASVVTAADTIAETAAGRWVSVKSDGYQIDARLPDSTDLAAAAAAGREDVARARKVLAERLVRARRDGSPVPVEQIPATLLDRALQALADSDPNAEITFAISCPNCGAVESANLDIGAQLWARIDADVQRGLREVAMLTRAFHWPERDILAMNEHRRRAYLELLA